MILVELPVLTTGLDLEGDLVKLATLFSVDLVRVGVVVALWVDSASFFLCNKLHAINLRDRTNFECNPVPADQSDRIRGRADGTTNFFE